MLYARHCFTCWGTSLNQTKIPTFQLGGAWVGRLQHSKQVNYIDPLESNTFYGKADRNGGREVEEGGMGKE